MEKQTHYDDDDWFGMCMCDDDDEFDDDVDGNWIRGGNINKKTKTKFRKNKKTKTKTQTKFRNTKKTKSKRK